MAGTADANGNALWVVELTRDELSEDRPKWDGIPANESGNSPLNNRR